jgi:hypothetical protein
MAITSEMFTYRDGGFSILSLSYHVERLSAEDTKPFAAERTRYELRNERLNDVQIEQMIPLIAHEHEKALAGKQAFPWRVTIRTPGGDTHVLMGADARRFLQHYDLALRCASCNAWFYVYEDYDPASTQCQHHDSPQVIQMALFDPETGQSLKERIDTAFSLA